MLYTPCTVTFGAGAAESNRAFASPENFSKSKEIMETAGDMGEAGDRTKGGVAGVKMSAPRVMTGKRMGESVVVLRDIW